MTDELKLTFDEWYNGKYDSTETKEDYKEFVYFSEHDPKIRAIEEEIKISKEKFGLKKYAVFY